MFKKMVNNLRWCVSAEGRQTICFDIRITALLLKLRLFYTVEQAHEPLHKGFDKLYRKYPQAKQTKRMAEWQEEQRPKSISKEDWDLIRSGQYPRRNAH
jgi:hypothetical protein